MSIRKIFIWIFVITVTLFADEIRLQDGGSFKGDIRAISETHIEIKTTFAGTLRVERSQISGFSINDPLFIRLQDGQVLSGTVSTPEPGAIELVCVENRVTTSLETVHQAWINPEDDPARRVEEVSVEEEQGRQWKYRGVANFSGKSGNSDERRLGMGVVARLVGKQDELKVEGSYDSRESNGQTSSDRRKVGVRYTSYFNDPWGWYVRHEFEDDKFKNLQLRSMSAIGFSYRQKDNKKDKLALNVGLNYRHETYVDQTPESSNIGLDLGLNHFFGVERRFELHNELTVVPSIEDFTNYLVSHDSYIDMPLNDSRRWKLRLGLENDYNSQPTGGRAALDSRYYSSFVMEWD